MSYFEFNVVIRLFLTAPTACDILMMVATLRRSISNAASATGEA